MEILALAKSYCLKRYSEFSDPLRRDMFVAMTNLMEQRVNEHCSIDKSLNRIGILLGVYFHDVGRVEDDTDTHPHTSARLLDSFLEEHEVDPDAKTVAIDCCLNHGSSASPTTREGEIVKILDKEVLLDGSILWIELLDNLRTKSPHDALLATAAKLRKWFAKLPSEELREKYHEQINGTLRLLDNTGQQ